MAYLVHREPRVPQRTATFSDAVHKVSNALHGNPSTTRNSGTSRAAVPCDGDIAFARSCHSAKARVELEAEMYRCALDFSDVEAILRSATVTAELQQSNSTSSSSSSLPALFQPIASDVHSGITLYSAPVDGCPMRMMCAHATMPCSAATFLQYMDTGVRPLWDKHTKCSLLVRDLNSLLAPSEMPGIASENDVSPDAPVSSFSAEKTARLSKALLLHAEYGKPSSGLSLAAMTTSSAQHATTHATTAERSTDDTTGTTMHIDGVGPRLASLTRPAHRESSEASKREVINSPHSATAACAAAHAVAAAAAAAAAAAQVVSANRTRAASYARRIQKTSNTTRVPSQQESLLHVKGEGTCTPLSPSLLSRPALRPGERRVGLHYLGVKSPVAFVQDRDFELVVGEWVREDGVAYMKAFSPPLGYAMPLDPHQSRYVRGVVLLAAVVARPYIVNASTQCNSLPPVLRAAPVQEEYCTISYLGLVHPMGMLPAVIVNVVTSVQMNALKQLQQFILHHPLPASHSPTMRLLRGVGQDGTTSAAGMSYDEGVTERGSVLDEIIDEATTTTTTTSSETNAPVQSKL